MTSITESPCSSRHSLVLWLGVAVVCLLGSGCASLNVNPPTARAETGYVDFYAVNDEALSWGVEQVATSGNRKRVFFEFDPIEESILRLAFKPGHYRLSVSINNRPILEPSTVEVAVHDGMVTPVRVTLVDAGTGQVVVKEARLRGTAYGRYGRGTKISGRETQLFGILTEAGAAVPYQMKLQMPYSVPASSKGSVKIR